MNSGGPPGVGVRVAGTGRCLPETVWSNDDLARIVDTSDEWITQRTGIRERRIADADTGARELGRAALAEALADAGVEPGELDLLICATLTPEMACPSTAARIVADVGAVPAGAMDLSAACSGFVYGMNLAASLIRTGAHRTIGVIGTEVLSRVTDWSDRRTCVLFGDGAGAAVLTASDRPEQGDLFQQMHSDGRRWKDLYLPERAAHVPEDDDGIFSGTFQTLQMNGREVYKFAVSTLKRSIDEALASCGLSSSDLAMVIPHQSNKRILESACERLALPEERFYINIERYGNTSAASVPICLDELRRDGPLREGQLVLFVALGGGLSWASSVWRL